MTVALTLYVAAPAVARLATRSDANLAARPPAGPSVPAPGRGPPGAPLHLRVRTPLALGRRGISVAGLWWRVEGRVGRPAARGLVRLTVTRGRRTVLRRRARVGHDGRFGVRLLLARPGRVRIRAVAGEAVRRGSRRVVLADPAVRPGSRGLLVRWVQARLRALRYLRIRPSGRFAGATAQGMMAFRHANGVRGFGLATGSDLRVIKLLRANRRGFRARFPKHGRHVEADLSKRIVVLLRGRRVVSILHTSPGKRSTPTVLGSFRFYSKRAGRNASGMVDSNYFLRGYAVHGYGFVPDFPDSHGCLRIPLADARFVFSQIRTGDRIDVYP